jgi:hypothetical protein
MAGYVFSLNNMESLKKIINNGVYSTNLTEPKNSRWLPHHEGTLTDYLTMKEGDNVYFFIKRKIYGIGILKNINDNCKFLNYPEADIPKMPIYGYIKDSLLLDETNESINNRFICSFYPHPYFFEKGIDMDDVLASNPDKFRILRAFWKLSFIKIADEENKALRDIILKRNEEFLNIKKGRFLFSESLQNSIKHKLSEKYYLTSENILKYSSREDYIKHEMAIEAHIADIITNKKDSVFGKWDFISYQVIASPFKPIDYMDKMDIFGYRNIAGFDTISKYLLIEIKRDSANKEAINQLMKYVDWINQEYSHGDYSMIEAFLVAYDFPEDVIKEKENICKRNYIKGRRPTESAEWRNVRLIKYKYDNNTSNLVFEEV